ncbi:MAG TPA: glycosyltransferase family 2 protein [Deltaproteobacteria bacterium]|nr:glycosyltransferase family 2 protein [Deltaproteobacteria bacterium]HPR53751.1 glycosyltransferase family 2 protein [Deltaproteobacteria bacterium]HXK46768.1 glycosyltransferase family 2 protein [Deltaproteobacteria bacterium]
MPEKRVAIIILNWNSPTETTGLLDTLEAQPYEDSHTIVIDNHSTDDSMEKLSAYRGTITLIRNEKNLGYAGGNNVGIDTAIDMQADYIWILNPDIRPTQEALSLLVETMDRDASIAAVGPRICYRDHPETVYSDGGLVYPERGFLVIHKNTGKTIQELNEPVISSVDYANGSAILLRSKALEKIGTFREDFFLYYEETEWCLRAKRQGWKVCINHDATVYHQSSRKGIRYHYFMARNRILLARVYGQHCIPSLKTELSILHEYTTRPYYPNMLYLCARIAGIVSGVLIHRRKMERGAKHELSLFI